jgi:hypothetical protein
VIRQEVTGIHRPTRPRYPDGMAATDPITPDPRRFSLRLPRPLWIGVTTIVMVVVAGALQFGLPVYRRHAAIREIDRVGGMVVTNLRGPGWLRRWAGDRLMTLIEDGKEVFLGRTPATDATLGHIGEFASLQSLHLDDTLVTDEGLTHLKRLNNLEELSLCGTQVTDMGLEHIKGLTRLRHLRLENTSVTDAGLMHLKGLTALRFLILRKTHVTDAGLVHLTGLPKLELVYVGFGRVSDAEISEIQKGFPTAQIVQ